MTKVIDPFKCMGKWYVTHVIPNFIEKIPGIYNETEEYEWDEAQQRFKVTLSYAKGKPSAERSFLYQRGWIWNKETGAEWRVSPMVFGFALPIKLKVCRSPANRRMRPSRVTPAPAARVITFWHRPHHRALVHACLAQYIIIDCADDYSHMTVGYPDRSFLWVMAREPNPPKEKVEAMLAVPESVGYDMSLVKPVPQEWPQ